MVLKKLLKNDQMVLYAKFSEANKLCFSIRRNAKKKAKKEEQWKNYRMRLFVAQKNLYSRVIYLKLHCWDGDNTQKKKKRK